MLNTLKNRKKEEGFTIIEVLIVLAIAGLILVVVLLAVPNLQRNSRNTALKEDANTTAGAVSEYLSNNDGTNATGIGGTAPNYTITGSGSATTPFKVSGSTTVAGSAAATTPVAPAYDAATTTPTGTKLGLNQVDVIFGQDCALSPNKRSTAIYYVLETTGNPVKCVTS